MMRRRWKVPENFWIVLLCLYAFGWLPLFIGIWALDVGLNYEGTSVPAVAAMCGWLFGAPLVYGAVMMPRWVRWLWAQRPRRVWESAEDMREAHRR